MRGQQRRREERTRERRREHSRGDGTTAEQRAQQKRREQLKREKNVSGSEKDKKEPFIILGVPKEMHCREEPLGNRHICISESFATLLRDFGIIYGRTRLHGIGEGGARFLRLFLCHMDDPWIEKRGQFLCRIFCITVEKNGKFGGSGGRGGGGGGGGAGGRRGVASVHGLNNV